MRTLRTLWMFLAVTAVGLAQGNRRREFEVASIKPAAPEARGMYIRSMPGGRVNITNMTLKEIIVYAYRIQPFQLSGGPSWLDSVHYDISAKSEESTTPDDMRLMLQSLMEDRFQLTIRRETKDFPIYALVMAKKDGKLGPKLVESKEGACTAPDPTKPPSPPEHGKAPTMYCGNMRMGPNNLTAVSIPVSRLTPMLSRTLGRTVVDKTGLTQNFDISMEWAPDDGQLAQIPADVPKPASSETAGPSIFTALQEQLGLKLESQKGPVEVLVIERAEKPSEN